jgi:EmrB/QacA subfamily drug resistance transporter
MSTVAQKTKNIPYTKRWTALFLLCTAQFMVIMDTSIIGVALPAIKEALGYSQSNLQWIFNAYVIFFGGLLLLGGRLSDLFGARKVFSAGFLILTLASLLAGFAWSEATMNAGRALQGLGSALIAPAALTLVMSMFTDPKELGKALGFWGASAAAGGSAGVFLGGVITEWLSWQWVFLINIPVGVVVLLSIPALLPVGQRKSGKIDWIGALSVTIALVLAVYAIITAEQTGWTSFQTIGLLSTAGVLFIMFLLIQRSVSEPLMPLRIFSVPNLSAANVVMLLLAAAWIPLWFFLNLYLQQILQLSAFNSGLALLPMTIAIMILMVGFTGKLVGKFGFKANLIAGLLILTGSLLLFAQLPVNGSFIGNVLFASLLAAVGMSLSYIPGTIASMSGAKPEETGLASGLVNTSYQIGSALGLAAMVAIASAKTSSFLDSGTKQIEALNAGFQSAFIGGGILAGIAAVIALLFVKTK